MNDDETEGAAYEVARQLHPDYDPAHDCCVCGAAKRIHVDRLGVALDPSWQDRVRDGRDVLAFCPPSWIEACRRLEDAERALIAAEEARERRERIEVVRAERRNRAWEEGRL